MRLNKKLRQQKILIKLRINMKLKEIEIRIKHIRKNKLIIKNATLDSDKEYKKQTN